MRDYRSEDRIPAPGLPGYFVEAIALNYDMVTGVCVWNGITGEGKKRWAVRVGMPYRDDTTEHAIALAMPKLIELANGRA